MSLLDKISLAYKIVSTTVENLPYIVREASSAIYSAATAKEAPALDARGIPTNACPVCGGNILTVDVIFDNNYEISFYMFDAMCAQCGTLVTAPTPENLVREDV